MKKLLIPIFCIGIGCVHAFHPAMADGDDNGGNSLKIKCSGIHNCNETTYNKGGTGYGGKGGKGGDGGTGVGIGIGKGGSAKAYGGKGYGGDATIEEGAVKNKVSTKVKVKTDVDVYNKNIGINTNLNKQGQGQGQEQGQKQGQGQGQDQYQSAKARQGQGQGQSLTNNGPQVVIEDKKVITYEAAASPAIASDVSTSQLQIRCPLYIQDGWSVAGSAIAGSASIGATNSEKIEVCFLLLASQNATSKDSSNAARKAAYCMAFDEAGVATDECDGWRDDLAPAKAETVATANDDESVSTGPDR